MQGLADAAADHLQTAKTFLGSPQAPLDGTAVSTKAAGGAQPGEASAAGVAGASPGSEKPRTGGAGGRRGTRQAPCKAANQGLSAVDLEALIAELVRGAGRAVGDGVTARVAMEATAEEVASWLVRDLGHRR